MIFDSDHSVGRGAELQADVCVIGSGAAGISLAHSLMKSGKKVILLEGSRQVTAPDYSNVPLELQPRTKHRYFDPEAQPLYGATMGAQLSKVDPIFPTRSRVRGYGGTTNSWYGFTAPLQPIDFDRSDLDPTYRWPIGKNDLDPYYNAALKYCSLGSWDVSVFGDPSFWIGKTEDMIALPSFPPNSPVEPYIMMIVPRGREFPAGNPDSRLEFQNVWGPAIETSDNVSLYKNAHVRHIESTSGRNSVSRLCVSTMRDGQAGHDFYVKAKHYIVAAGAIETARLLLASDGLGNGLDQVGRYFMAHPHIVRSVEGLSPPSREVGVFFAGSAVQGFKPSPIVWGMLVPKTEFLIEQAIGNFKILVPSPTKLGIYFEQVPSPDSRVTLDRAARDPIFGDSQAHIDWQLLPKDMHTMEIADRATLEAIGSISPIHNSTRDYDFPFIGEHQMGTTRMSSQSSDGVVDTNCRVHGVDNLFVASGAVFRSGGQANPTFTIIALALRLAEHLAHL